MNTAWLINLLTNLEPLLCVAVLVAMYSRNQWYKYKLFAALLLTRLVSLLICIPVMRMAGHQLQPSFAYKTIFWVYWLSYGIEAVLAFLLIFSIYQLAMAPLKGLQVLGSLMFRWAASISIVLAVGMALTPRVNGHSFIVSICAQLQQTQSILTLCLLVFVAYAVKPMGLSFNSKIFGISLGLAVFGFSELVSSAWLASGSTMFSAMNVFNGLAAITALSVWTVYFAVPEPRRRMIILPTTSPFLRWNQISLALGDDPGYVAIAGFPPENLAPAEIEIMKRASVKMAVPAFRLQAERAH